VRHHNLVTPSQRKRHTAQRCTADDAAARPFVLVGGNPMEVPPVNIFPIARSRRLTLAVVGLLALPAVLVGLDRSASAPAATSESDVG
jgi:hypothetical protein